MSERRFLCLGAGDGWHTNQLVAAASALSCELRFATYESLSARIGNVACELTCEAGAVDSFDAVLTRTMPAGSLEQITFRLAILHSLVDVAARASETMAMAIGSARSGSSLPSAASTVGSMRAPPAIVNPPRALEIAIDKFATLARVSQLGYAVPNTMVVQSRREAMDAFASLGGDCVIKPLFGGEGRGVMRVCEAELAWYTFSTLEQLGAVCYVQQFIPPGGSDTRLLVIGEDVIGVRRRNHQDFRTNVSSGGTSESSEPSEHEVTLARRICDSIGLRFASVDLIDDANGEPKVIEVNAIPGWKGAQSVSRINIAQRIIQLLESEASASSGTPC